MAVKIRLTRLGSKRNPFYRIVVKWLKDGAKPTDTVHNILSKQGILKTFDEQKRSK